jgi:type VI secretion system protein ImpM
VSAATAAITAGWFGKIPATGDFITRRLPEPFREAWDRWLQQVLAGSRERLGAGWDECYLSMPAWRFLLSPGMVGAGGWAGVLVPSVDAVGRRFPLTVACALPGENVDLPGTALAAAAWLAAVEGIALDALEQRHDAARLDGALAAQPFSAAWLRRRPESADATVPFRSAAARMLAVPAAQLARHAAQLGEPGALWLAGDSELFPATALLCEKPPTGAQFCGMMDGRWSEHGWNAPQRRDAEAA